MIDIKRGPSPINQEPRGVEAVFNAGTTIRVRTPDELVKHGIHVSPEYVKATWNSVEAATKYSTDIAAARRNRQAAVRG